MRVLVIGLDCLPPGIPAEVMPAVSGIARAGTGGVLRSTLPPITVPAWSSMLTGRDPGELGLYGFRNRRSFGYGDLAYASGSSLRFPRLWDRMTACGRPSVVVGVPQTSPPPALRGALVCGFEGPADRAGTYTHPPELRREVEDVVGEYLFDVPDFRNTPLGQVRDTACLMTARRFALMRHLLATREWEFAMLHEIGPDRMHHCFWHYHDPAHPRYEKHPEYSDAIRGYYRLLDREVAELVAEAGDDTAVLVASDHGVMPMHGGICVNEMLRAAGLLVLRTEPRSAGPLTADMVQWDKTSAWAEGGYYARIFFNLRGREPNGTVARDAVGGLIAEITDLLGTIDLGDGRILHNQIRRPAELYRRVRGIPPDLLVFFHNEQWRSIGSVGIGREWVCANDVGVDEANHSRNGMFALRAPGMALPAAPEASILAVAPTVLGLLGLPADPTLQGKSLLTPE